MGNMRNWTFRKMFPVWTSPVQTAAPLIQIHSIIHMECGNKSIRYMKSTRSSILNLEIFQAGMPIQPNPIDQKVDNRYRDIVNQSHD